MPYSKEQKIKAVTLFFETKSPTETQRCYCAHFGVRVPPTPKTIHAWVKKFKEMGSIADKPRSGRPKVPDATKDRVRVTKLQNRSKDTCP
jgi:transposase